MKKYPLLLMATFYIVINLFIFSFCRLFFLENFTESSAKDNVLDVLSGGFRLDLSLISCELLLITLIHLALRKMQPRPLFLTLWSLTGLHIMFNVGDLFFFNERHQHVAEMLLAYITSPYQAWVATYPFIAAHPVLFSFMFGLAVLFFYVGYLGSKRPRVDSQLTSHKQTITLALFSIMFFISASFSYIPVKKTRDASGEQLKFIRSSHFAHYSSFILNQAVINPIHELLFFQLPSVMKPSLPYILSPEEALATSISTLNIKVNNPEWPLLRKVEPSKSHTFSNIVTVQIEGLSASIFEHEKNGQKVMPYLTNLAKQGLYFPNTMQSFNATAGSVFSTVTGFHKISFDEKTKRFTSSELNAYYGSLPHILGNKQYEHYYFGGFRQSALDFLRFMGNQGYQTYGYESLSERLKKKGTFTAADSTLGLFDQAFLTESALILNEANRHYTAHLVTSTSHSPWSIPESASTHFNVPALNAFAYVDQAIKAFMQVLAKKPERFADTLFVFVADHSSYTFNDDLLETIRIPLIFYTPSKSLKLPRKKLETIASHVDIIPSVLSLLHGEHQHSGMGSSLFTQQRTGSALSGSRYHGIYAKQGYMFQFLPYEEENKLSQLQNSTQNRTITPKNVDEIKTNMKQEYLAQYELAKRLSVNKRIYPQ